MPNYVRSEPTGYREIDRWDEGVGWLAHPEETGRRASHAVNGIDGVWLLDPIDAPGVDDLIAEFGEVAGVAVLSNWHARDAGVLARRHDVSVHLPAWMTRVEERVDAPVERYSTDSGDASSGACGFGDSGVGSGGLTDAGFRVRQCNPLPGWREGIAYGESDGTLYVPESMGTAPAYTVGEERLGVSLIRRPFPPADLLAGLEPDRVLVGHGAGVFDAADEALADALAGARRRFPRALAEHAGTQLLALVEAARG